MTDLCWTIIWNPSNVSFSTSRQIADAAGEALNLDEEQKVISEFEDHVDLIIGLITNLKALQSAHTDISDLHTEIDFLEETLTTRPDKDHSAMIAQIRDMAQLMRMAMSKSSLSTDHPLREKLITLRNRASLLSSTDRKIEPTSLASTLAPPTCHHKTVQLPKITLPTFNGELNCTKISNWGSIPNSKAKVCRLTDALSKTVSSLKHMGQLDRIYVFTSLVVPFLSSELKMAWEIYTRDQTLRQRTHHLLENSIGRYARNSIYPHSEDQRGATIQET